MISTVANMSSTEKMTVTMTGVSLAAVVAIAGFVWYAAQQWTSVTQENTQNTTARHDTEQRLRSLENNVAEMKTDVSWIRGRMEGKQ